MIVKICCAVFGDGFNPVTIKSPDGEVLYDESAEGVKVWWNYLVSLGVTAFSPVVELWIFMVGYFALRFPFIIAKFKRKKPGTDTAQPPAPAKTPQKETRPTEEKSPPEQPTPEPAPPTPPPVKPAEARTVAVEEGED